MPSFCDIQTQGKIINLVKLILNYYQSLETTGPIKYYAHNEIDTILTEFEGLSNSRKIILATSIETKFVPIIMKIFQCVYDSNYWVFENIENSVRVGQVDDDELLVLLTYSNLNLWIKYLEMVCCGEVDIFETSIANEQIYTSIPPIEPKYYRSTKRQKIYTIADIINLVEKDA
jgi:hypothetical protein